MKEINKDIINAIIAGLIESELAGDLVILLKLQLQ